MPDSPARSRRARTTGPPARRALVIAAAAAALVAVGACSAAEAPPAPGTPVTTTALSPRATVPGSGAGGPTGTVGTVPRTAPPRSRARITAFEAPSTIACNGLVNVRVTTTYATTDAASVAFLVDNQQVPGSPPPSGTFELPMRCDGSTHTIVLSAIDDQGRSTVQSKAILTDDRQSGG